jgi:hypothetical protein
MDVVVGFVDLEYWHRFHAAAYLSGGQCCMSTTKSTYRLMACSMRSILRQEIPPYV